MQIKFCFSIVIFLSMTNPATWAQDFDFSCYSGKVKLNSGKISEIRLGWSRLPNWSSFVIFKTEDGKFYSEDASCPTAPKLGTCGIFDDGGFFEMITSKKAPPSEEFDLRINGTPGLQKGDGANEWRLQIISGPSTLVVPLTRTSKTLCRYNLH
jgi:hypothetical protein